MSTPSAVNQQIRNLKARTLTVAAAIAALLAPTAYFLWFQGDLEPVPPSSPWGHQMFTGPGPHALENRWVRGEFNEGAAIISSDRFGPTPEQYLWEDVILEDDGDAAWGGRIYDVGAGSVFRRVTVIDTGCETPGCGKEEGHGLYPSGASGDVLFEWCRFVRCGGQALQWVARKTEAAPGMYPCAGTVTLRNVSAEDCGQLPSRGSWPISLVTTGHSFALQNVSVQTLNLQPWEDPIWGPSQSRGGILIGPGGNEGEDASVTTPTATLREVHVHVKSSDRHLAKFNRIGNLDVENCTFFDEDRRGSILIGSEVDEIRWVNVDGNFDLWHDLDGDWSKDPGEVMEGPLDYRWSRN